VLRKSKAVSLRELLGLPLRLLDFSEHISSEQAVVMNLAFARLQGETGGRMHLTEHRLKDLSLHEAFKKRVFIRNVAKDAAIGCMSCW